MFLFNCLGLKELSEFFRWMMELVIMLHLVMVPMRYSFCGASVYGLMTSVGSLMARLWFMKVVQRGQG